MSKHILRGPIEAILMVASEPVDASELADVLGVSADDIDAELRALASEYLGEGQDRPRVHPHHHRRAEQRRYAARGRSGRVKS